MWSFHILLIALVGFKIINAGDGPSSKPENVKVESISSTSLRVTWQASPSFEWNGEPMGFYVGYKLFRCLSCSYYFETVEYSKEEENKECSLEIQDLDPYTQYTITVQAYNSFGAGPMSDEIYQYTAEGTPDQPPSDVTCEALSSQTIHVSWVIPPLESVHGVIKGYKVIYAPTELWHDEKEKNFTKTNSTTKNLYDLKIFTNYTIQVLATTNGGDGVLSSPIHCKTGQDFPEAPSDVKALVNGPQSILVLWRPPARMNGILSQYSIYWHEVGNEAGQKKRNVEPFQTKFEVYGLKTNKSYEFWVTASTDSGEGPKSTSAIAIPNDELAPPKIATFDDTFTALFNQSVKLPCLAVGSPTPDIAWKVKGGELVPNERLQILEQGTLFITDVVRQDAGDYTCIAENSMGKDSITHKLVVLAPPRPPQVKIVATTTDSITVKLEPHELETAPVHGYTLFHQPNSGAWVKDEVTADVRKYIIENLACGSGYLLYATAHNSIGTSEASDIINTRTKGWKPMKPEISKFIEPSSNSVRLHLGSWRDGGCQMKHFSIEYEKIDSNERYTVSNHVSPGGELVVYDLEPATRYNFRINAHNIAGSTVANYEFATLNVHGGVIAPKSEQIPSKKQVLCDAKNQSQIANVNTECQEMILADLDFEGLVNVSQISRHFSDLANELMRRKFASIDSVLIGPTNENGAIDTENGKWKLSNGVLKLHPDIAEGFLRGFGHFIKKLDIRFDHIKDHQKFGLLVNRHCSDTLLEFTELEGGQKFFNAIEKPFRRVERVSIHTDCLKNNFIVNLNDLFPEVRYLTLKQFSPKFEANQDFPIVYKYPNLIELQISAYVFHFFENLFQLNPHLRKIRCEYIESTEPLRTINDHFPELEALGFSLTDGFDNYNGPVVHFKNVKDVFIADFRQQCDEVNPEMFNFEMLEILRFVKSANCPKRIGEWIKVIRKHKNIKKLFVNVYFSSDELLDLTKELIHLEEASIINYENEPIEQFQQKLGSEWNITYSVKDNRLDFTKITPLKIDNDESDENELIAGLFVAPKLVDLLKFASKNQYSLELATAAFHKAYRKKTFAIHSPKSSVDPIVVDYASLDTVHIHDVETTVKLLKTFGNLIAKLSISYTDSNQYTEINNLISDQCSESLTELHFASFNGNMWSNAKKPFRSVQRLSIGRTIEKTANETMSLGNLFPNIKELHLDAVGILDKTFLEQTFPLLVNLSIKFAPFNGSNYLQLRDVDQFVKHNPQIRVLHSSNADLTKFLDGINQSGKLEFDQTPTTVPPLLLKTTEPHSTAQSELRLKGFYEELDQIIRQLSVVDATKLTMDIMQRANEFLKTTKA